MKWMSRRGLIGIISGTLGTLLCGPIVSAAGPKEHKYRYSEIDMPVSLAVGTVRTPEFPVIHEAYFIMIQTEKRLPFVDQECMMGLMSGPLEKSECKKEPLLQTNWTVWDGEHIVAQGSNRTEADAEFTDKYLFK